MADHQQTDTSTSPPTNSSKNNVDRVSSSESPRPSSSSTLAGTKRQKKTNRQGRRARRKRIKAAEIEKAAAVAAAAASTATTINTTTVLNNSSTSTTTPTPTTGMIPTDRNYVLPAVKQLSQISQSQKLELSKQLGYIPGNALRVAATATKVYASPSSDDCGDNTAVDENDNVNESKSELSGLQQPLVLELYPLALRNETDGKKGRQRKRKKSATTSKNDSNDDDDDSSHQSMLIEPFPTIYWLTHVHIRALISKLELDRWCPKLELRLKNDPAAKESMKLAHQEYARIRYDLLSQQDKVYIANRGWNARVFSIEHCGIAGIRNFDCIKCLHAHAAHYLSGCTKNVVGLWVVEEVQRMIQKKTTTTATTTTRDDVDESTGSNQGSMPT